MYLATLTPNITFGALLGLATDQYMVSIARECLKRCEAHLCVYISNKNALNKYYGIKFVIFSICVIGLNI
jgi:hypothetical protein